MLVGAISLIPCCSDHPYVLLLKRFVASFLLTWYTICGSSEQAIPLSSNAGGSDLTDPMLRRSSLRTTAEKICCQFPPDMVHYMRKLGASNPIEQQCWWERSH